MKLHKDGDQQCKEQPLSTAPNEFGSELTTSPSCPHLDDRTRKSRLLPNATRAQPQDQVQDRGSKSCWDLGRAEIRAGVRPAFSKFVKPDRAMHSIAAVRAVTLRTDDRTNATMQFAC